jgi:hypothetical protein
MKQYSKVEILNNDYWNGWIIKWDIWYIIEIYDDGMCEVEFSDKDTWVTRALIIMNSSNLKNLE